MSHVNFLPSMKLSKSHLIVRFPSTASNLILSRLSSYTVEQVDDVDGSPSFPMGNGFNTVSVCSHGLSPYGFPKVSSDTDCRPMYPSSEIVKAPPKLSDSTR